MNNPGHHEPHNTDRERQDRKEQEVEGLRYDLTNPEISASEWFKTSNQIDELLNAPTDAQTTDPVVAASANDAFYNAQPTVSTDIESPRPVNDLTYREETEFNADGTPNVNWAKE